MAATLFHAPLTFFFSFPSFLFLSCFPAAAGFYRFRLSVSFTLAFSFYLFSSLLFYVLRRGYAGFPRMANHRAADAIPFAHLFMRLADGCFEHSSLSTISTERGNSPSNNRLGSVMGEGGEGGR